MTVRKFKVGDRVELLKDYADPYFKGQQGTITMVDSATVATYPYRMLADGAKDKGIEGATMVLAENEIKAVETASWAPSFNVGDKFKNAQGEVVEVTGSCLAEMVEYTHVNGAGVYTRSVQVFNDRFPDVVQPAFEVGKRYRRNSSHTPANDGKEIVILAQASNGTFFAEVVKQKSESQPVGTGYVLSPNAIEMYTEIS